MSLNGLKLKDLKNTPPNSKMNDKEIGNTDVAIIGMSCNFPDAKSPEEFWNNISSGKISIKEFPQSRVNNIKDYLKLKGKKNISYLKGAYLEHIDKFDSDFFKITPKEASFMNPVQRLFLENVWQTVEDSGYGGNKLSGTNTGVYLGFGGDIEGNKYMQMLSEIFGWEQLSIAIAGNLSSIIPSRISYILDLTGPSMVIDTACSSSLVAVHTACQAIRNGECDQAIAGGIRISLLPLQDSLKAGMESSDGLTRAFDDSSDGTGLGEGVGTVFLKPLYRAEEDGDPIYAVIKGSAINQDGATMGITSPNPLAQMQVIKKAWDNAKVHPETISYIEAHGTGTKLGDPIEIDGITRAFSEYTNKKQFCGLGSVKTNIGHLYEAAGIASLIKAVLCLENKKLPPSINFNVPNEKINFLESPIFIVNSLIDWETECVPRRCGISSFGFSGTNCHLILEEYVQKEEVTSNKRNKKRIFALSAKKKELLEGYIERYIEYLTKNSNMNIDDICYTAGTGRGHYKHRVAFTIESVEELLSKLKSIKELDESVNKEIYYGANEEKQSLDEEAEILLNCDLITEKNLEKLCELYVNGASIHWDNLYQNEKRKRVRLPTYYFADKTLWFQIEKS